MGVFPSKEMVYGEDGSRHARGNEQDESFPERRFVLHQWNGPFPDCRCSIGHEVAEEGVPVL